MVSISGTEFNFMKAVVVKSHNATDETQLELKLNDIVYVLEQDDSGWWGGHKEGEDCTGWFPGTCVRQIEEEIPEPGSEPPPMPCSPEAANSRSGTGLSVVPEEIAASARLRAASNCEDGLDIVNNHEALFQDNRMVASPNRRVSGSAAGSPGKHRQSAGADDATISNLQAEIKTISAIAEDRNGETQRLQAELKEVEAARNAESTAARREREELKRQFEQRNAEVQVAAEAQVEKLRQQLAKAQQDLQSERSQFERLLQEKDAETRDAHETCRLLRSRQATSGPSASQLATEDPRRCLFPSAGNSTLFPGVGGTPSFSTTDMAGLVNDMAPVDTHGSVNSVASSNETVRPTAFRKPSHPPSQAGFGRPAAPTPHNQQQSPRPFCNTSTSLTRPASQQAFRPISMSPGALSPGGLAKCMSTGDLPSTPRLDPEEVPTTGSVKEKKAFFEKVLAARPGTPSRSSVATEGRSFIADTPNRNYAPNLNAAQKSPVESSRWRENSRPAKSPGAFAGLTGIDMPRVQDPVDDQVNFNMSPMRRNQ